MTFVVVTAANDLVRVPVEKKSETTRHKIEHFDQVIFRYPNVLSSSHRAS